MTIDEKVENKPHILQPDQLVAFAVLADLKLAQRSAGIDTNKIAELVVIAKNTTSGIFKKTPIFDIREFELSYMCSRYVSQTIEDYVKYLEEIGLAVYYKDHVVGPEGIDKFKVVVNKLYKENPEAAKAYIQLVNSSPERFFHPEGKGHWV
jgi:hypothetical protein